MNMTVHTLNEDGSYRCDSFVDKDGSLTDAEAVLWTADAIPQPSYGMNNPVYVAGSVSEATGEVKGGRWVVDEPAVSEEESLRLSASCIEREWRGKELNRADIELNKVQDGVGSGTVSAWRTYRCQLRDWPASPDFPDKGSRPVAPDTN